MVGLFTVAADEFLLHGVIGGEFFEMSLMKNVGSGVTDMGDMELVSLYLAEGKGAAGTGFGMSDGDFMGNDLVYFVDQFCQFILALFVTVGFVGAFQ